MPPSAPAGTAVDTGATSGAADTCLAVTRGPRPHSLVRQMAPEKLLTWLWTLVICQRVFTSAATRFSEVLNKYAEVAPIAYLH